MGAKYNIYVDPAAAAAAAQQRAIAGQVEGIANGLQTTSQLTQLGNNDLSKIAAGNVGDTTYGNALRTDAARQKKTLDMSNAVAQRARQVAGPGANGDLVYKRMLDRSKSQIDDETSDTMARSLPAWMGAAGEMSMTDNRLANEKIGALSGAGSMYGNAYATQAAGTRVEKKKSWWENLVGGVKDVVGIAGSIAALSDERAKDDIQAVDPDESREVLRQLGAKSFAYKKEIDPDQKQEVGNIAQEVEAAEPRAVQEREDGLKEVKVMPLLSHTMNAVKGLIDDSDQMKSDIAQIKQLLMQGMGGAASAPAPAPAAPSPAM